MGGNFHFHLRLAMKSFYRSRNFMPHIAEIMGKDDRSVIRPAGLQTRFY